MRNAASFSGKELRAARIERGLKADDLRAYLGVETCEGVRSIERRQAVSPERVGDYFKALAAAGVDRGVQ